MKGFPARPMHPLLQILVLVGLAFAGLCLGSFVGLVLATQVYGYSVASFAQISTNPAGSAHGWPALMLLQGLSLAGLGAGAALMPAVVGAPWAGYFAPRRLAGAGGPLGAGALILVLIPLMSVLVAWNAGVHFPAFLHGFEVWARASEDQAGALTKFLTQFGTAGRLLVGVLVIAVVPAVAEELVFRGVIQQNLVRWFGSRHAGVWAAAAIFSAIHFQFFGFVPRFVLGLILGYLYEWSGNILVPMAAHFTNNAFQLVLLYLVQRGAFGWNTAFDPDSTEALPWPLALASAVLAGALLWGLRQRMGPWGPRARCAPSAARAWPWAPGPPCRNIGLLSRVLLSLLLLNPDLPPADALPPAKRAPSNLRLRVIWGTIAAALLIGCTYGGPISFGLFFAAVQAVMLKEFYRIMRAAGYKPAFWWGIVAGSLIFLSVAITLVALPKHVNSLNGLEAVVALLNWAGTFEAGVIAAFAMLVILPVLLFVRAMRLWPEQQQPVENIAITMLGLLYVSLPMTCLNYLAVGASGFEPSHVFCLIILVWAADTGAYFAGKNFGKHKLAPSISPGKTWEGWAGGALLALATGWAFGQFVPDIPLTHRLVAAGVVAVFGPLGDLAESMLKRSAGVKDSGTFLPGHGGLLDRFDAFLLVLPVLVLLQLLAG